MQRRNWLKCSSSVLAGCWNHVKLQPLSPPGRMSEADEQGSIPLVYVFMTMIRNHYHLHPPAPSPIFSPSCSTWCLPCQLSFPTYPLASSSIQWKVVIIRFRAGFVSFPTLKIPKGLFHKMQDFSNGQVKKCKGRDIRR